MDLLGHSFLSVWLRVTRHTPGFLKSQHIWVGACIRPEGSNNYSCEMKPQYWVLLSQAHRKQVSHKSMYKQKKQHYSSTIESSDNYFSGKLYFIVYITDCCTYNVYSERKLVLLKAISIQCIFLLARVHNI